MSVLAIPALPVCSYHFLVPKFDVDARCGRQAHEFEEIPAAARCRRLDAMSRSVPWGAYAFGPLTECCNGKGGNSLRISSEAWMERCTLLESSAPGQFVYGSTLIA